MDDRYTLQEQSRAIDALRFPMTILVVCIHFNILLYPLVSHGEIIQYNLTWVQYPITLFSEVLGRIAVPFFFLISGYFFFFKEKRFTTEVYVRKVKRRFFTLLIPYIAWWFLAGVFNIILSKYKLAYPVSLNDFLIGVWYTKGADSILTTSINTPLNGPLWFVRDLMVMVLLSPIVFFTIRNRNKSAIFILFFALLYVFVGGNDLPQYIVPGLSIPCILFFSIGAYFGWHKLNFLNLVYRWRWGLIPLTTILLVLDTCITGYENPVSWNSHLVQNGYLHHTLILFGVISSVYMGTYISKSKLFLRLSSSSFVLFALHKPIILPVGYIVVRFLNIESFISPIMAFALYTGVILFMSFVGVTVYKIIALDKTLLNVLSGGR